MIIFKNKKVCKGCKYRLGNGNGKLLEGTCNYCYETGKSRVMIEKANGGVKPDSCICYEKRGKPQRKALTVCP